MKTMACIRLLGSALGAVFLLASCSVTYDHATGAKGVTIDPEAVSIALEYFSTK